MRWFVNKSDLASKLDNATTTLCEALMMDGAICVSYLHRWIALALLCICFASALHLLCICFASALHLLCICFASALHLLCICFASALHLLCSALLCRNNFGKRTSRGGSMAIRLTCNPRLCSWQPMTPYKGRKTTPRPRSSSGSTSDARAVARAVTPASMV